MEIFFKFLWSYQKATHRFQQIFSNIYLYLYCNGKLCHFDIHFIFYRIQTYCPVSKATYLCHFTLGKDEYGGYLQQQKNPKKFFQQGDQNGQGWQKNKTMVFTRK
jgi:hypothetical protein